MCGIAGIVAYDSRAPAVDAGELVRIRERMRARGPDGAGLWQSQDRRVGLAHRRLAIVEIGAAGAQPMRDLETGNQIVFNGEIYNHEVLRKELPDDGEMFRTRSDTEVLLRLYARRGSAMLGRLRGMFAFAIWDARRNRLFLARDAFGIKPLYLADDGRSLRFASQVKALLAGDVDTRPEPAGHAGFLLWGSVPEPFTLYRGIRALPPGHWLQVDGGRVGSPVCFDSPLAALRSMPVAAGPGAEADARKKIAAAVEDSVAAHLVADVEVGVFLSAGLDSSMLAACAARRQGAERLRTLTVGFAEFAEGTHDEVPLASRIAAGLDARHEVCRVAGTDFASERDALLEAMDQPSIDGINVWIASRAAARQGLKVVLSGIGGDELFGSYPSFVQVPALARRLRALRGRPWVGRSIRRGLTPLSPLLPSPKYAGLLEYGVSLQGAYLLRRALFMPWELGRLMDPAAASEGMQRLGTLERLAASIEGLDSPRRAISALEMQWYMRNQLLRDADWAGMAHSVEIRVPFVDTTLLRGMVEMPLLAGAEEKRAVARAVAPTLPAAAFDRPKTGFAVPIHKWLNPGTAPTVGNHRGWALQLHRQFAGDVVAP